jgi:type IV pilus assembly protein PilB
MRNKETFAQELSDILIKQRIVSPEVARQIQESYGRSSIDEFDDFLLEEGLVAKEDVLKALSDYYKVPAIDVSGKFFDRLLLQNFPKEFLVRNVIIPLEEENEDMFMVVAADPARPGLEAAIREFANADVSFLVGIRQDIIDAIREYYDKADTEDAHHIEDSYDGAEQEAQPRNVALYEEEEKGDDVVEELTDEDKLG